MFGFKLTALVGIAAILVAAGAYIAGHRDGRFVEREKWELQVAKQKAEAAVRLQAETEKVLVKDRQLAELVNKTEADHVAAKNALDAASSKYDRLGSLFERTKARCGVGGNATTSGNSVAAAVDHVGTDTGTDVLGAGGRAFRELIYDADRMRTAFMACQGYVRELPGVVNR